MAIARVTIRSVLATGADAPAAMWRHAIAVVALSSATAWAQVAPDSILSGTEALLAQGEFHQVVDRLAQVDDTSWSRRDAARRAYQLAVALTETGEYARALGVTETGEQSARAAGADDLIAQILSVRGNA